jgi:hypothetical protein
VSTKEQLLPTVAEAFEQLIEVAQGAAVHGVSRQTDSWGPREIVAHLAGWEMIAAVHIPKIVASMSPLFTYPDKTQQETLNEALNTMMVTLVGEQPLTILCDMLRQAYQRDIEMLEKLDESLFQPGQYVYGRTKAIIDHCHEHVEGLLLNWAMLYQEQGKSVQAEPLVKRALTICEQALGADHPHTQSVRRTYDLLVQEMERNL